MNKLDIYYEFGSDKDKNGRDITTQLCVDTNNEYYLCNSSPQSYVFCREYDYRMTDGIVKISREHALKWAERYFAPKDYDRIKNFDFEYERYCDYASDMYEEMRGGYDYGYW